MYHVVSLMVSCSVAIISIFHFRLRTRLAYRYIAGFGKLHFGEINDDITLSGADKLKYFVSVCFSSIVLQGHYTLSNDGHKSGDV